MKRHGVPTASFFAVLFALVSLCAGAIVEEFSSSEVRQPDFAAEELVWTIQDVGVPEVEIAEAFLELEVGDVISGSIGAGHLEGEVVVVTDQRRFEAGSGTVRLDITRALQRSRMLGSEKVTLQFGSILAGESNLIGLTDREEDGIIARVVILVVPEILGLAQPTLSKGSVETASMTRERPIGRADVLGSYPNPFNPSTVIRLLLPAQMEVVVRIYDGRGRLVKESPPETLNAGVHDLPWNGSDAQGRRVASGVYYYRIKAGSEMFLGKLALLK